MDDLQINSGRSAQFVPNILMPLPDHDFDPLKRQSLGRLAAIKDGKLYSALNMETFQKPIYIG